MKGPPVSLRVTGIVVYRGAADDPLGEGGVVVRKQLPVLAVGAKQNVNAYVLATPGRAEFLFRELSSRLEVHGARDPARDPQPPRPADAARGARARAGRGGRRRGGPRAARRRPRHARDLAVLTVLGATPAQVRATLAVAALATVLPAVLVGVPVGLGVARVVWWEVATSTGVAGDVAVPVALLLVIGPGLVVGGAARRGDPGGAGGADAACGRAGGGVHPTRGGTGRRWARVPQR